jgi:hypothetical protein
LNESASIGIDANVGHKERDRQAGRKTDTWAGGQTLPSIKTFLVYFVKKKPDNYENIFMNRFFVKLMNTARM